MLRNEILLQVESTYGIDIAFDVRTGAQGSKDVIDDSDYLATPATDFQYVLGTEALAQELQRMFDLSPVGSFIDTPDYGIDWSFIGTPNDPKITIPLAQVAIRRALQHPSFAERFRLYSLDVWFQDDTPNALYARGILECFGFDGVQLAQWGPVALRWLTLGAV